MRGIRFSAIPRSRCRGFTGSASQISPCVCLGSLLLLAALAGCQRAEPQTETTVLSAGEEPALPQAPVSQPATSNEVTSATFDISALAPRADDPLASADDMGELPEVLAAFLREGPWESPSSVTPEGNQLEVAGSQMFIEQAAQVIEALKQAEASRAADPTAKEVLSFEPQRDNPYSATSFAPLVVKAYVIDNLLPENASPDHRQELVELVHSICAPITWDYVGGLGVMRPWRGVLLVAQTERVHARLAQTLELLRQARQLQLAWQNRTGPLPDPEPLFTRTTNTANEPIFAALDKKSSFHFQDTSLTALAATLSRAYDIEVVVEEEELQDAGLGGDIELSYDLNNISLRSFLRIALREYGLSFEVYGGQLHLTTPVNYCHVISTVLYPSSDLLDEHVSIEQLTALFEDTVDPTSWDKVGGVGSIATWCDAIFIVQEPSVQLECEELWRQLRAGRQLMQAWDGVTPPPTCLFPTCTPWCDDLALRQNLQQQVDLPERTLALSELATLLGEEFGCQTCFDRGDVMDGHLNPAAQLKFGGSGMLADILREDLEPLAHSFLIESEIVWIVPDDSYLHDWATIRVYPLFDLTSLPTEEGEPRRHNADAAQAIREAIEVNVSPNDWSDLGGEGDLGTYGGELLVVRQTAELHREVERFLEDFRADAAKTLRDHATE